MYFRSQQAHQNDGNNVMLPIDQRFKARVTPTKGKRGMLSPVAKTTTSHKTRININPVQNYFVGKGIQHFESINGALKKLAEKQMELAKLPAETSEVATLTECVEMCEVCTQTTPELEDIREVDVDMSCNYIMQGSKLIEFIRLSTSHAAKCGGRLRLVKSDNSQGCYLKQTWKCPCCLENLFLENCDMVKTTSVAQGAKYSAPQADFNIRLLKGLHLVGINNTKMGEFLQGEMGIKIANRRNRMTQLTKVRSTIGAVFDDRKMENRREHVEAEAVRKMENYQGDVEFEDVHGNKHSICAGPICHDGAGYTRAYL